MVCSVIEKRSSDKTIFIPSLRRLQILSIIHLKKTTFLTPLTLFSNAPTPSWKYKRLGIFDQPLYLKWQSTILLFDADKVLMKLDFVRFGKVQKADHPRSLLIVRSAKYRTRVAVDIR